MLGGRSACACVASTTMLEFNIKILKYTRLLHGKRKFAFCFTPAPLPSLATHSSLVHLQAYPLTQFYSVFRRIDFVFRFFFSQNCSPTACCAIVAVTTTYAALEDKNNVNASLERMQLVLRNSRL